MPFWDYIHFGRPERQQHHNLQEGLFQIASQTCSLLVQVNNTNNISYGNNSTNIQYNSLNATVSSSTTSTNGFSTRFHTSESRSSRRTTTATTSSNQTLDSEQSVVLIPQATTSSGSGNAAKNLFSHYKHRLSVSKKNNKIL